MSNRIWPITDDIQCQQLTSEYLEEALDLIEAAFFPHEIVCKTLKISEDPEAVLELRELSRCAASDGVSVVAVNNKTSKVVGVGLNKIQVKGAEVYEDFYNSWKRPPSRALVEFMSSIENRCNLFEYCDVDCFLELMFMGTSPDFRAAGIARKMTDVTFEIGTKLKQGINVKKSLDGGELPLEPVPKLFASIVTNISTQKICADYGLEFVVEEDFEKIDFHGLDFSHVAAQQGTKKLKLGYLRI